MRVAVGRILYRNNQILLGLRSKDRPFYPNVWDVLGGHCESGESIEQTLIRELQEECGVTPVRFTKLGVFTEPSPDQHGKGQYHIFVVQEWQGEPEKRNEEHQMLRWFSLAELSAIPLASEAYLEIFSKLP